MIEENKRQFQRLLDEMARLTLEDAENYNGYNAEDLFNASQVFLYLLMDLGWQYSESKNMSMDERGRAITKTGKALREITKEATGLDMHEIVKQMLEDHGK